MTQNTTIQFKPVLPGKAKGKALVLREPISFQGEIDEEGRIVVGGNPYAGESVTGRVLIYPEAKGSSGGCMMLRLLAKRGKKPATIVNTRNLDPQSCGRCHSCRDPDVMLPSSGSLRGHFNRRSRGSKWGSGHSYKDQVTWQFQNFMGGVG